MLSHTHNQQQYDNPFARSDDNDGFDFYQAGTTSIEPDVDLTGQSSTKQQQSQPFVNPFANLSGSIGSSSRPAQQQTPTSYDPAQYTGEDTLDEPVSVTIVSN